LICCTRRTEFAREVAGSPASKEPATGTTAMPRAISESRAVLDARDTRVRARACRSARVATSSPARFPRARASGSRSVPAAYPFEIGSPLTLLPPLPPSTDTSCFPPTSPSSCPRVACSPRYVSEPRYGSTPTPRPNAGDTEARCRDRIAAARDPTRSPRARAGVSRDSSSPRARVARSARLTRASPFPSLSHRRSGAVSACSSPAVGCTTPSTGPSPTSCCTGASPAARFRARFFQTDAPRLAPDPAAAPGGDRVDRLASRAETSATPPRRPLGERGDGAPTPSRGTTEGFRCSGFLVAQKKKATETRI
jgi:hypothetical protein